MLEAARQPVCRTTLVPAPAHQPCRTVALRRRAHIGSGRILFLKATLSTACPSSTLTRGLPLATTERSSGQPMVVTAGLFNRVEPQIPCTEFRSPTETTAQRLAVPEQL